jgi:hypothetical protein
MWPSLTKDQLPELPLISASLTDSLTDSLTGITDKEAKKDQRLCLYVVVRT